MLPWLNPTRPPTISLPVTSPLKNELLTIPSLAPTRPPASHAVPVTSPVERHMSIVAPWSL